MKREDKLLATEAMAVGLDHTFPTIKPMGEIMIRREDYVICSALFTFHSLGVEGVMVVSLCVCV